MEELSIHSITYNALPDNGGWHNLFVKVRKVNGGLEVDRLYIVKDDSPVHAEHIKLRVDPLTGEGCDNGVWVPLLNLNWRGPPLAAKEWKRG